MGKAILVNVKDNVVTMVSDVQKDRPIIYKVNSDTKELNALENIPYGHKVAIADIRQGEPIFKYGEVVGRARTDIRRGQWVHTNNTDETYVPSQYPICFTLPGDMASGKEGKKS
jgi:altronate dehydratase small subunit